MARNSLNEALVFSTRATHETDFMFFVWLYEVDIRAIARKREPRISVANYTMPHMFALRKSSSIARSRTRIVALDFAAIVK